MFRNVASGGRRESKQTQVGHDTMTCLISYIGKSHVARPLAVAAAVAAAVLTRRVKRKNVTPQDNPFVSFLLIKKGGQKPSTNWLQFQEEANDGMRYYVATEGPPWAPF